MDYFSKQSLLNSVHADLNELEHWLEFIAHGRELHDRTQRFYDMNESMVSRSFSQLYDYVIAAEWDETCGLHLTDAVTVVHEFVGVIGPFNEYTGRGFLDDKQDYIHKGAWARVIYDAVAGTELQEDVDFGVDTLSIDSLANLANMSEQAVRNAMSKGEFPSYKDENSDRYVKAEEIIDWLEKRKGFCRTKVIRHESEAASGQAKGETLVVPMAADGTLFHPGLKRSGGYQVGKKGAEQYWPTFEEALANLHGMDTPRWRRPSPKTGVPSIVRAVGWKEIAKEDLFGPQYMQTS